MSSTALLSSVLASLDWDGPIDDEPRLEPIAELVRSRLGDGALRWVMGAVESSLSRVHDQIQDSLAPRSRFRALSQHILINILFDLAGDSHFPDDRIVIDPELSADFVARGITLADVTGGLRELQRHWLVGLTKAALEVDRDGARLAPEIAASVTTTMDAWVHAMTEAIVERRRQVTKAGELRIREAVEALIAAEPVDVEVTSAMTGVPLTGWHLCCVVGSSAGALIDRSKVDVAAQSLARWAGVEPALRYETDRGKTYLWSTTRLAPTAPPLTALEVPPPLVVGMGEPHRGTDGFRRSFVEAHDSMLLALRTGLDGTLRYRDAALAINLSQDEERCRWFVEFELGVLAEDSDEMADWRNTLRAFYAARMRIAPAAAHLFVHRNTLINRLERIEQLLGHRLSERTAEVQAALTIAEAHLISDPSTPPA